MAILTNAPSSLIRGVVSSTITLSRPTLVTQQSITDPFWSDSTNWQSITFQYKDATGSETRMLNFGSSNTASFQVSNKARINTWQCVSIKIIDFDSGVYVIPRSSFTSTTEFDISITSDAPSLVSPQLHFNPALANAGAGPFTAGTELSGTTYTEVVASNNGSIIGNTGVGTWQGNGTGGSPYRFNMSGTSNLAMTLASDLAAGGANQTLQFWANMTLGGIEQDWCSNTSTYSFVYMTGNSSYVAQNNSPATSVTRSGLTIPNGAWHLYTFKRNSSGNLDFLVDGVSIDSFTNANLVPMVIHSIFGNPGYSNSCAKDVGDIWIFDQALLTSDVLAYYNATKATYGL